VLDHDISEVGIQDEMDLLRKDVGFCFQSNATSMISMTIPRKFGSFPAEGDHWT